MDSSKLENSSIVNSIKQDQNGIITVELNDTTTQPLQKLLDRNPIKIIDCNFNDTPTITLQNSKELSEYRELSDEEWDRFIVELSFYITVQEISSSEESVTITTTADTLVEFQRLFTTFGVYISKIEKESEEMDVTVLRKTYKDEDITENFQEQKYESIKDAIVMSIDNFVCQSCGEPLDPRINISVKTDGQQMNVENRFKIDIGRKYIITDEISYETKDMGLRSHYIVREEKNRELQFKTSVRGFICEDCSLLYLIDLDRNNNFQVLNETEVQSDNSNSLISIYPAPYIDWKLNEVYLEEFSDFIED